MIRSLFIKCLVSISLLSMTGPTFASSVLTSDNKVSPQIAMIETGRVSQSATVNQIPGVAVYARNCGMDEARRLAADGVIIGQDSENGCIHLIAGNILLNQDKDMAVCFEQGKICIGANSMVFVMRSEEGLVLYDLYQAKPKQVFVMVNNQKLFVEPSQMLVLTSQSTDDFEKLGLNCHCVDYCNGAALHLPNSQLQAYSAQFSIVSAMVSIRPLKSLVCSHNQQDKSALDKLIKGAIILQDMFSGGM